MSDKFKVEIISPEQKILSTEASEVTIPSYEGQMGILKDHIPLITFFSFGKFNYLNFFTFFYRPTFLFLFI
mgnify:CR=1 FL=1